MGRVGDVYENPVTGERALLRLGHTLQLSDSKASRVISIAPTQTATGSDNPTSVQEFL